MTTTPPEDNASNPSTNPRIWIRLRHKFNTGEKTDWEWIERPPGPEEEIEEAMREHREAYVLNNAIDHNGYRGMEWEYAEVPNEVLIELIQKVKKAISRHERQITHLRHLLLPEALRPWRQAWSSNHITLERKIGDTRLNVSIHKYTGECKVFSVTSDTCLNLRLLQDCFKVQVTGNEQMMLDAVAEWEQRYRGVSP